MIERQSTRINTCFELITRVTTPSRNFFFFFRTVTEYIFVYAYVWVSAISLNISVAFYINRQIPEDFKQILKEVETKHGIQAGRNTKRK